MAVYRFKVCMEDNEDIVRDIDIKAAQTFEQFHQIIQEAFKFDAKHAASFFVSDDYWRKGQEITLYKEDLPLDEEEVRKSVEPKRLMSETRIAKYIEQPHQRFVYVFDPKVQWTFLVEMLRITDESNRVSYPNIVKSLGTAPKQYKQAPVLKEEKQVSPEEALLGAILGTKAGEDEEEDEEIYKTIETVEEGIEEDDIEALEGEEGEEPEGDGADAEEGSEGDAAEDFGHDPEDEH